jgi:hypothetical protein
MICNVRKGTVEASPSAQLAKQIFGYSSLIECEPSGDAFIIIQEECIVKEKEKQEIFQKQSSV